MPKIVRVRHTADGYEVVVRTLNAYSDGTHRDDVYKLSPSEVLDATPEQMRAALRRRIAGVSALSEALSPGDDLPDAVDTKSALEEAMRANLEAWRAWQWRLDNVSLYGLNGGALTVVTNALTARRNACVQKDLALLQRWRVATDDLS